MFNGIWLFISFSLSSFLFLRIPQLTHETVTQVKNMSSFWALNFLRLPFDIWPKHTHGQRSFLVRCAGVTSRTHRIWMKAKETERDLTMIVRSNGMDSWRWAPSIAGRPANVRWFETHGVCAELLLCWTEKNMCVEEIVGARVLCAMHRCTLLSKCMVNIHYYRSLAFSTTIIAALCCAVLFVFTPFGTNWSKYVSSIHSNWTPRRSYR